MNEAYKALGYNKANYIPLTPLSFLHRTADIYGDREAIVYGDKRYNWRQCRERCIRIASSLARSGAIFTSKGGQFGKSFSVLISFLICCVPCNVRRPGVLGELTLMTA